MQAYKNRVEKFEEIRKAKDNELLALQKENYDLQEKNRILIDANRLLEGENHQLKLDIDEVI